MKRPVFIGLLLLLALAACDTTTHEARRMVHRAEQLADTLPDSTARLIDSVLRMPANFSERERMDMALLQAEALFGDHGDAISPLMDDDFFDDKGNLSTSPELERAAAYYAKKKQYAKAAHAALYSGFVQQHYNEKEAAMRSFKEAEQNGKLVADSLAVAQAEYRMARLLYDDFMEEDALVLLEKADSMFGGHHVERAYVQNAKAIGFIMLKQFDNSEQSLQKSLVHAKLSHSDKAKLKAINNYSVLYRLQGKFDQAIDCLRQIEKLQSLNVSEELLLYLNLGNAFAAYGTIDSATIYYTRMEELLAFAQVKDKTKVSAYGALYRFAESQGNSDLALRYIKTHEKLMSGLLSSIEKKSVYRVQQQYDYRNLQNEMNRKLIQRQKIIEVVGILAIIGLAALAFSQIRLAKTRKQEAEAKSSLFYFMQQNKALVQKSEEQKQNQIYLTKKHKESEQAYEDLLKEKERQKQTAAEYGEKLSYELKKEQSIMLRLHLFLQNQGDEELLKKLEKSVFGKQAHLDAMMETVDRLYPELREIVKQEDLGLDENEQMDVIMSYFNISRQDEALLLDKTTDMVDKIRNRSRKKIQSASEGNKLPKMM